MRHSDSLRDTGDNQYYIEHLIYKHLKEIVNAWQQDSSFAECDAAEYSCLYLHRFQDILNNPSLQCDVLSGKIRGVLYQNGLFQRRLETDRQIALIHKCAVELSHHLAAYSRF